MSRKDHHLDGPFEPQTPLGSYPPSRAPSPFNPKKRKSIQPRPEDISVFLRWAIHPLSALKLLLIPPLLVVAFSFAPVFPALAPLAKLRVAIPWPQLQFSGFWGPIWNGWSPGAVEIRWQMIRLADFFRAFYTTANPIPPSATYEPAWAAAKLGYDTDSFHQATFAATGNLLKSPVFYPPQDSNPAFNSPVEYAKSPLDVLYVVYAVVVFSLLRQLLAITVGRYLGRWWGIRRPEKLERFGEQFYAILYWGTMSVWGLYIMKDLPTWFYRTEPLWTGYFDHWTMPKGLKQYYLLQISFWFQQLFVMVLGLEAPRKDYYELIAHHVVTIWLVFWSYVLNYTRIGHLVYISMDLPDTVLATSKLLNYMQLDVAKTVVFVALIFVWSYFRIYQNIRLIHSIWVDYYRLIPDDMHIWEWTRGIYLKEWLRRQIVLPMIVLLLLNIFWYWLILRIAWRTVAGKALDDDRSDDEGDNDKED